MFKKEEVFIMMASSNTRRLQLQPLENVGLSVNPNGKEKHYKLQNSW